MPCARLVAVPSTKMLLFVFLLLAALAARVECSARASVASVPRSASQVVQVTGDATHTSLGEFTAPFAVVLSMPAETSMLCSNVTHTQAMEVLLALSSMVRVAVDTENARALVYYSEPGTPAQCTAFFRSIGVVHVERIVFLNAAAPLSLWVRDFGPLLTVNAEDELQPLAVTLGSFSGWGDGDRAFATDFARRFGLPATPLDGASLRGGNFLSNGNGVCISAYEGPLHAASMGAQLGCQTVFWLESLPDCAVQNVDSYMTWADANVLVVGR